MKRLYQQIPRKGQFWLVRVAAIHRPEEDSCIIFDWKPHWAQFVLFLFIHDFKPIIPIKNVINLNVENVPLPKYLPLYRDAFHFPINNTIHNRLGEEVTQLPSLTQEIPVSCLLYLSPVCIIGSQSMTSHLIYTSSEFEKMQILKIQVSSCWFYSYHTYRQSKHCSK